MKSLIDILNETVDELQLEFAFYPGPKFVLYFFLPKEYYDKIVIEAMEASNFSSPEGFEMTDLVYITNTNITCSIQKTDNSKTNDITNKFIDNIIKAILKDEYV